MEFLANFTGAHWIVIALVIGLVIAALAFMRLPAKKRVDHGSAGPLVGVSMLFESLVLLPYIFIGIVLFLVAIILLLIAFL